MLYTDMDRGMWAVVTDSGTVYVMDMDRMLTARLPGVAAAHALGSDPQQAAAKLRRDTHMIPLLRKPHVEVGKQMTMWLDILQNGVTTLRQTNVVIMVEQLDAGGDPCQ